MKATLVIAVVLASASSCLTSSSAPCVDEGTVFVAPRVERVAPVPDAGVTLQVAWSTTAALPASFFANPEVRGMTARTLEVLLPALTRADAGFAEVSFDSVANEQLRFQLRYRESSRLCPHVGMDDVYLLQVNAVVLSDGGMGAVEVKPDVDVGAL